MFFYGYVARDFNAKNCKPSQCVPYLSLWLFIIIWLILYLYYLKKNWHSYTYLAVFFQLYLPSNIQDIKLTLRTIWRGRFRKSYNNFYVCIASVFWDTNWHNVLLYQISDMINNNKKICWIPRQLQNMELPFLGTTKPRGTHFIDPALNLSFKKVLMFFCNGFTHYD